uniref:Potassium channel domain-containing protein n=1 Tax=viral metagenome TaxID=1070528 RepID=A0A6C0JDL7_9ZZZZ
MLLHLHFFKKTKYFIFYNLLAVLFFGVLYYFLQDYDYDELSLVSNIHKKKRYSMLDCMYFSLITQTTVGYEDHGGIRLERIKIANIVQLLSIFFISALSLE